jgi:quercetin dioxygenase-like cupin family protein
MQVFNLKAAAQPQAAGKNTTVIHQTENFKVRTIELPPGGEIPSCEMAANVIFYVAEGKAEITVDGESTSLIEGQGIVSAPATISMKSSVGARLLGVQIMTAGRTV